eukprot:m.536483 g.536483  ORF g.536483 m.536483 type:complete len:418 (+) comp22072_c0_seq6:1679-2932(+)
MTTTLACLHVSTSVACDLACGSGPACVRVVARGAVPRGDVGGAGVDARCDAAEAVVNDAVVARHHPKRRRAAPRVVERGHQRRIAMLPRGTRRPIALVRQRRGIAGARAAVRNTRPASGTRAVGQPLFPPHAAVVKVVCHPHVFVVVVVHRVEPPATDKSARGAVDKRVVVDVPARHLIVKVHGLDGDALHAAPARVLDVAEQRVAQGVAWVDKRGGLLSARVERPRVRRLERAVVERVVLEQIVDTAPRGTLVAAAKHAVVGRVGERVVCIRIAHSGPVNTRLVGTLVLCHAGDGVAGHGAVSRRECACVAAVRADADTANILHRRRGYHRICCIGQVDPHHAMSVYVHIFHHDTHDIVRRNSCGCRVRHCDAAEGDVRYTVQLHRGRIHRQHGNIGGAPLRQRHRGLVVHHPRRV